MKDQIIGKSKIVSNLEIAQYDFPEKLSWNDSVKFCSDLGEGWRLPNEDELNTLYQNKEDIGEFKEDYYWSSRQNGTFEVIVQDFEYGDYAPFLKSAKHFLRVVRNV